MSASPAAGLLARQLKQMQTDKDIPGISCGLADNNIFEWEVMLMINDECKFYGGKLPSCHLVSTEWRLMFARRRLLSSPTVFPVRVSSPTTEDEVRDTDLSPKQYAPTSHSSLRDIVLTATRSLFLWRGVHLDPTSSGRR